MADADVAITAGAGTKIDTRTVGAGVDEHRQVVVIGDPATAANVVSCDAANGLDVDVTRVTGDVAVKQHTTGAAAQTSVVSTITANTTLIAADATREGLLIYNESTAVLTVLAGAGVQSATVYSFKIDPNGYYEAPWGFAALRFSGAWAVANGSARVTALT